MAVEGSERTDRPVTSATSCRTSSCCVRRFVRSTAQVAVRPADRFHFHTGRPLAARLGYDAGRLSTGCRIGRSSRSPVSPTRSRCVSCRPVSASSMSDRAQGSTRSSPPTRSVRQGRVVGVDMTPEMLDKSRETAVELGLDHVEFREGLAEALPVEDGWADVVISNGVINLCADKRAVLDEIRRVLRPGGWLQFADIANGRPVPAGGDARRRLVDRLNRRRAAPCGLADDARAGRLHRMS